MRRRDVPARLLVALVVAVEACHGSVEAVQVPWPNQPAGFTLVSDYGFSDPLPIGLSAPVGSSGWGINNDGSATRISDATARMSPPFVGQWSYPVGFVGGSGPAAMFKTNNGGNELYIGFYWKASNPWQDHSAGNKIAFQFTAGGGQAFLMMTSPASGGNHLLRPTLEFPVQGFRNLEPNVNQTMITLGTWHLIEWYMNRSATTMKWWLDGVLQGNYTDVVYPAQAFGDFAFDPTWGGTGETKTEQDYFWYDHVRISRR